ncbi:ARABIDOPSIS THALIANA GIBBERELLIN 3 BETA-HYDROXYLASE 1, GA REQUIRING 4, gibberellin 3-oxidase 1 [Hibiscus trionum]|uniref:gibberellin 3beta-dioxygenase n=1 Tax=Hibiscus trionum TaxID=183268 RepID=A0A9W7I2K0_HIBTR|nr:ARABIDOPSIS THALIANA GIBBERELLIN 3 BETA-HYDROXYLASE 1, GA REQUIRING 4, gibberellin 3-oxidase 1 [Hibiscus trionum]
MTTTLSQVYSENLIHLHHIIPLDFDSVRTVPDSHVWPKSDEFSSDHQLTIPIIDLKDPNAVKLAGQACETWGAFQVINHGIPLNLLEEVESETRRLFSLPAETKMKALREPAGAAGYGLPLISKFFPKYMWHEGFTIMGSPADHARMLWPNDNARFCDVMDRYQKKMEVVAEKLTNLILGSLEITGEDLNRDAGSPFGAALQLNSYPPCPNPNRAMGLAPHTDTSLVTIVQQTAASGLQIFKQGAGWVSVLPIAGALVVNVGDLLHILSNARFPSALHRAVLDRDGCHRYSMAYFYGLPSDCRVSPSLKLLSSGENPRYRSVTVKEYVRIKSKNFEEALSLIRI